MKFFEAEGLRVYGKNGTGDRLFVIVSGDSGVPAFMKSSLPVDIHFLCVSCPDWNALLSPWPAPACFRGGEAFAGKADEYLSLLTRSVIPRAVEHFSMCVRKASVLGYSLAGLFALYALFRCDMFSSAASVSGSLWYPRFTEYLKREASAKHASAVYLSVGDREAKTQNPVLRTVSEKTQESFRILNACGIPAFFEFNPGNHFYEPDKRMLRAIGTLAGMDDK